MDVTFQIHLFVFSNATHQETPLFSIAEVLLRKSKAASHPEPVTAPMQDFYMKYMK